MLDHLQETIKAAGETIASGNKSREERIAEVIADEKKTPFIPADRPGVTRVAQALAKDESYGMIEISYTRAYASYSKLVLHLQDKYRNAPDVGDAEGATPVGDKRVRTDPAEARALAAMYRAVVELGTARQEYAESFAEKAGLVKNDRTVVDSALFATALTEQEYAAGEAVQKQKVPVEQKQKG